MKRLIDLITKIEPSVLSRRERELRNLILTDGWAVESDLADTLWPGDQFRTKYYRDTRDRMLKHLNQVVWGLDHNSVYQGNFAECYKEYLTLQLLKSLGRRKEVEYLAGRLLKKAIRFEISEVVVSTADILHVHYAGIVGDNNKAKEYLTIAEKYEQIQINERKAMRLFNSMASHFTQSRVGKTDTLEIVEKTAHQLSANLETNTSFRYRYYSYYAMAINAQLKEDKKSLIKICDESLRFFQTKSYAIPNAVQFLFGFELRASLALQTKDYDFARRSVNMGLELTKNIPYNYSICLINKAVIGFHSQDNTLVMEAIQESKQYRSFEKQKEQWHIIDAFAHFLDIETTKFKLGKFLNQVPTFSQDKQGLNITIIVIQVLHYIKKGDFGILIDRFDALQKYTTRHLKRDHTYRSNCFLKMILLLPQKNFHPVAIERHAAPILKKLKTYKEGSDIEIVPYEKLWGEVMRCLELQHVK